MSFMKVVWRLMFFVNLIILKKRAAGFKLLDRMDLPTDLVEFKLVGTIRSSYFTIKDDQEARIKKT